MTSNATSIAILLFSLTLARADFSCAAYTLPSSYYRQPGLNCTLASDLDARCLTLEVPLEPTAPARGNISLFVKNVRARRQPAIGEIWLINGGPGESGVGVECLVAPLMELTAGQFNIVIPDHRLRGWCRGAGRSTPLMCGNRTGTMDEGCIRQAVRQHGAQYLNSFSVTNAAHDLVAAVAYSRSQSNGTAYSIMAYAVSYGTLLLQRSLQLNSQLFDAVHLDGVCAPDLTRIEYASNGVDAVGAQLLGSCASNHKCKQRLGNRPLTSLDLLYEQIRSGGLPCANQLGAALNGTQLIQETFGFFLEDPVQRLLIAPAVSRLLRCNRDDVGALKKMFSQSLAVNVSNGSLRGALWRPRADESVAGNGLLAFNILTGDMLDFAHTPITTEQQSSIQRDLRFNLGNAGTGILDLIRSTEFPIYPRSPLANSYPDTSVPLILTSGDLDPQTPYEWARAAAMHYHRDHQQLISIPFAVHASIYPGRSLVADLSPFDCTMRIAASFFNSSGLHVETSCVEHLVELDFGGELEATRAISRSYFGRDSLWD